MKRKLAVILILGSIIIIACNQQTKNTANKLSFDKYLGDYVTDSYENRSEGYDWVAVTLDTLGINQYQVIVRSRSDRKKPTCRYSSEVVPLNDSTLKSLAYRWYLPLSR